MPRRASKRVLICLLATAARALVPRPHRIGRALPKRSSATEPIVDADAEFIDGAAGPADMDAVTLVAVAAPPTRTKPKPSKKRQTKSPQSLKVAAATLALAATAPVPTTLFAWHPALAALSLPLAAAAGVVVAGPQPVFYPTITPSARHEHAIESPSSRAPGLWKCSACRASSLESEVLLPHLHAIAALTPSTRRNNAGRAAAAKRASGADRRATLERRVKLHFVLSAAASWCLVLSTAAVFLSKAQARRPHLVSAHARAGAAALVAWFGALFDCGVPSCFLCFFCHPNDSWPSYNDVGAWGRSDRCAAPRWRRGGALGEAASLRVAVAGVGASDVRVWRWYALDAAVRDAVVRRRLAAELKVWRDGPPWRAAPRFLWSDQSHRRLGVGALLVLGGAAATGLALTGFGTRLAAPRRRTALAAVCVCVLLEAYDRRRDFGKFVFRSVR